MSPVAVSAQLAAFVWFTDRYPNPCDRREDAMRFASQNWEVFLPLAHEGLGRLLLKIANGRATRRKRTRNGARAVAPRVPAFPLPAIESPFFRS